MAGECKVWAGSGSRLLVLIELEPPRPLSLEPGGPVQTGRVQGLGLERPLVFFVGWSGSGLLVLGG